MYHYLINEHINSMPLLTFLASPKVEKIGSPEKKNSHQHLSKKSLSKAQMSAFSGVSPSKEQMNSLGSKSSLKNPQQRSINRKKRDLTSNQSQSPPTNSSSSKLFNAVETTSKEKTRKHKKHKKSNQRRALQIQNLFT